jgi:hypothetical protein
MMFGILDQYPEGLRFEFSTIVTDHIVKGGETFLCVMTSHMKLGVDPSLEMYIHEGLGYLDI